MLPVEAAGAIGSGLGDGAVDLFHSWDQDVFIAAMRATGSVDALEDDVWQATFRVAVVDGGEGGKLATIRAGVSLSIHLTVLLNTLLSTRRVVDCIINYIYDEGASTNGRVNKRSQSN